MRNADLRSIVRDPRLTSDAARCVLFVAAMGPGEHEVDRLEFEELLNHAGERKVAKALKLAVRAGWLRRVKGGWGANDRFQYTVPAKSAATEEAPVPAKSAATEEVLSQPKAQPQGPVPAESAGTTRARATKGSLEVVEDVVARANGVFELDARLTEIFAGDEWQGMRGALMDYLRDRVETGRQWGYVHTLQTWFQGSAAGPKNFLGMSEGEQRLMVASALNEMLQLSPREEKLAFRSARGKAGTTHQLRAKIEYLIDRKDDHGKAGRGGSQIGIGGDFGGFPEDG